MKKTIQWVSSFLIFLILAGGGVLFTYALDAMHQIRMIDKINSGYLSPMAAWFSIQKSISFSPEDACAQLEEGCLLYYQPGNTFDLLYIYGMCETTAYHLKSGRQFTASDFQSNTALALVGGKVQDHISPDQNIIISGENATLVGILGLRMPSMLDYMRIVLPGPESRSILGTGTWMIDGESSANIEKSYQNICKTIPQAEIKRLEPEYTGTFRMYRQSATLPMVLGGIGTSVLCAFFALTSFWLNCRKQLISVWIICGLSNRKIAWLMESRFVLLPLAGFVSGGALGALFGLLSYSGAAARWLLLSLASTGAVLLLLHAMLSILLAKWTVKDIRG